jgi:hypothetical protein
MASPAGLTEQREVAETALMPGPSGLLLSLYGLGAAPWEEKVGNAVPARALANTMRWILLWTKRSTCFLILRT